MKKLSRAMVGLACLLICVNAGYNAIRDQFVFTEIPEEYWQAKDDGFVSFPRKTTGYLIADENSGELLSAVKTEFIFTVRKNEASYILFATTFWNEREGAISLGEIALVRAIPFWDTKKGKRVLMARIIEDSRSVELKLGKNLFDRLKKAISKCPFENREDDSEQISPPAKNEIGWSV
jgi:hypothetical protein